MKTKTRGRRRGRRESSGVEEVVEQLSLPLVPLPATLTATLDFLTNTLRGVRVAARGDGVAERDGVEEGVR